MNQPSVSLYTASQIARCLGGMKRQAVHRLLSGIPSAQVIVNGTPAAAWELAALPVESQARLASEAERRGYRNAEQLLSDTPNHWVPPLPMASISQVFISKATKLRDAMAATLARVNDSSISESDLCSAGASDFMRAFGTPISSRHFRRLLDRTIRRDGGAGNWLRLELYLDEAAFAKPTPHPEEYQHRELDGIIPALENRAAPTPNDRAYLFDAAFHHYEKLTDDLSESAEAERQRRKAKYTLLAYLRSMLPGLSKSDSSLRRVFELNLQKWRDGGRSPQALQDKRPENSGKVGRQLCAQCRPLVIGGAVELDGDLSQAWRRLQLGNQLCRNCASIGAFDVRRAKSQVPKSVRRDVMPDILSALPFRRGPKHARLGSPYVRRDWSDIGPGDWAECDDMTPNDVTHGVVEMLTWDSDKGGHPFIGRMEVLVQIDRRTDYPWAYLIVLGDPATAFTPQRKATYNSVHCRLLFLRGHDSLGLPHAGGGYVLENSVWRSRLIDGPRLQHWNSSTWLNTEMGLKDPRISLNIHHALPGNPRSKVIERMFLSVQNRMRSTPGFIGFNERQDKRERMADFINRVKAGKEHPGNEVPSIAEFRKLLDAELMAHASEPQNGQRLPGVSPMEAFHNGIDGHPGIKSRPLRNLGPDARFLLSSHERRLPVTAQGIRFKAGGAEFVFWGPELEPFQNREIIARFNFEQPELLTCQTPDGTPFTVKARILPSSTATKEQLEESCKARASWMRQGKLIFDNLPHPFKANIVRDSEQSQETRDLGRFHNEETEKFREEKTAATRTLHKAQREAAEIGVSVSPTHRNPERALAGIQRMKEARERMARQAQAPRDADQPSDGTRPKKYYLIGTRTYQPRPAKTAESEREPAHE